MCLSLHCSSKWSRRRTRRKTIILESFVHPLERALMTSRLSDWIEIFLKPLLSRINTPSRIPHNSALKGVQCPRNLLQPNIQLPWWSRITPPTVVWPDEVVTATPVCKWTRDSLKSDCGAGLFLVAREVAMYCQAQLRETLMTSFTDQVIFWKINKFLLFQMARESYQTG